MARTYSIADKVKRIAESKVIPSWHPEIAQLKIKYLFTDEMFDKNRELLAKIKKASGLELFLSECSLLLMVNYPAWERMDAKQRLALIDHELCHVKVDVDKAGQVSFKMVSHDVEEFEAVVKRHGLWKRDLMDFQMSLSLADNVERISKA